MASLIALSAFAAAPADAAEPRANVLPTWRGGMDLYRSGYYSGQDATYKCVGASVQMMLNMIRHRTDHSWINQDGYWRYARSHNRYRYPSKGSDPAGWVAALAYWGQSYRVVRHASLMGAVRAAAKRIRLTGKPVGLLVDKGTHAWIMSGFTATADPARTAQYTIRSVAILAPLWPRLFGNHSDPAPDTHMTVARLGVMFNRYTELFPTIWTGAYVTVEP